MTTGSGELFIRYVVSLLAGACFTAPLLFVYYWIRSRLKLNRKQHEGTLACAKYHCAWHHVDEPEDGYRVCGECLHTYPTRLHLAWTYWRRAPKEVPYRDRIRLPSRIFFCPECSHNF